MYLNVLCVYELFEYLIITNSISYEPKYSLVIAYFW